MSTLGITGYDSFEFVVTDIERSHKFYVDRMDFREVARSSAELSRKTGEESRVYRAGRITVQVTTPLHQRSRAAKYLAWHPDGIPEISFAVKDVDRAFRLLDERGAAFLADPVETRDGERSFRHFAIASPLGDVSLRFVERRDWTGYAPGFEDLTPTDPGNRFDFKAIDHVTVNLLAMRPWTNWLQDTLGWEQFWEVQFHTEDVRQGDSGSGLRSIVMRDPDSGVKFATNEPLRPFFNDSQIYKFVADHRGAGVQHVALITPRIIPAVEGLRERGVKFLGTPSIYYEALKERFSKVNLSLSTIKEPMDVLERNAILIDGANERYMLQIFLQEADQYYDDPKAGPFFFEIIQRAGDPGFGAGNFRALFEAIERDQVGRARALDSAT